MLSDSALRRRLKRKFNRSVQRFFIPCAPGMEATLHAEVERLLSTAALPADIEATQGGVAVSSHLHAMYYCNLWLRTANRVLLRIDEFWADSLPALFSHASRAPWELFLGFSPTVSVRSSSTKSRLSTGDALESSLAAAINARFTDLRSPIRIVPAGSSDAPTVYVRSFRDRVTLSIDTSGAHLFKRGYRSPGAAAPLRPTLAAGMLLESRWDMQHPLVDPFCGSGTIAVEAMMMSHNVAPGRQRRFAFEMLPFFNVSLWDRLQRPPEFERARRSRPPIFASDLDPDALVLAQRNATTAIPESVLSINVRDALALSASDLGLQDSGWIVSNLPYGKRVSTTASPGRFALDVLAKWRTRFSGWHVTIATPRSTTDWAKYVARSRVVSTVNGGIPIDIISGILQENTDGDA